ncbi:uncharacterized protein PAC_15083 [Phialocephala subalpina]|uniref:Tautomerase cis-CaaD-like domain-containing protein n=1 Tax=Phialocephala subalpina TaxID=576137 RepID=A0A1L7XJI7_9HELO|nr:uncharacterized protein PAC_15083 [Phialocephala subalpina]
MPLWSINHSPECFSQEEKTAMAKAITKLYQAYGLPAFYVQVIFNEIPPTSLFIGGEGHSKFAGVSIYHVARAFQSDGQKKRFLDDADSVLNPVLGPKGMDWEYFVTESPRDLWKTNGIVPPETGSDLEKKWIEENRPVSKI